jgi:hypothetical protein
MEGWKIGKQQLGNQRRRQHQGALCGDSACIAPESLQSMRLPRVASCLQWQAACVRAPLVVSSANSGTLFGFFEFDI